MRKLFALFIILISCSYLLAQESNLWSEVNEAVIGKNLFAARIKPSAYKILQLREIDFINGLKTIPSERTMPVTQSPAIISFPDADGKIQRFKVVEAPVMDGALAARFPGIQSFTGKGIDDPAATVRFSVSQLGVYGMILSTTKPTVYIDPIDRESKSYVVVSRNAIGAGSDHFQCLTEDMGLKTESTNGVLLRNANDGKLRSYRLALCCTGEFSQHWLNGTETSDAERKAKVLAALNNVMTRTNGIYERDFSVRMVLIANNDAVIYLNASTDPFTTSGSWNSQTQSTCDGVIGSANYDVGHMVTKASNNGNAGCIACVCKAGSKGSGWTAYANPSSDYFVVDYLTHEMGHQFGGNHTFTFQNEGTIAQVEPGSGSTIMGYAGITGQYDVQPHSDDYFHAISIQQVTDYIQGTTGGGCAVTTLTGNNIPTANANSDYIIPRSTPFILNGSGTDADGSDVLTYCWEQMDARATGTSTIPSATATSGPQFRSYLPATNTSRTIPILSSILSGTNSNTWEVLPSVARTVHFRFTVKDNHAGGGGNQSDDMVLTISGTTGPFTVTAPNTAVTWGAGTNQTVTWSVNGTNGSPVNCATVNILLSTDGGSSFTTLVAGTPNDGSEVITVPDSPGSTNRIKVEAVGNIFFDISNTNFTIGTPPACSDPTGLNTTAITTNSATVNWSSVSSALSYDVDYKVGSSGTWTNASTGTTSLSVNLSGLTASTLYDWRVRANCSGGSGNYVTSQFTTSTPAGACPGPYDVGTNGSIGGAATIPLNTDIKGTVSARGDNDYYRFSISTSGSITATLTTLPANYQLSLLNSNGTTIAISENNGTANETISAIVSAGIYYARVYPKANASNASSCYTLRVQTGTASRGDGNLIKSGSVTIFPNPAGNKLNVSIDDLRSNAQLKIYSVMGKLVMQLQTNKPMTELNITRLPAGIYMLTITEGTAVRSIKFVKE